MDIESGLSIKLTRFEALMLLEFLKSSLKDKHTNVLHLLKEKLAFNLE